jgi:hypothetical protein
MMRRFGRTVAADSPVRAEREFPGGECAGFTRVGRTLRNDPTPFYPVWPVPAGYPITLQAFP